MHYNTCGMMPYRYHRSFDNAGDLHVETDRAPYARAHPACEHSGYPRLSTRRARVAGRCSRYTPALSVTVLSRHPTRGNELVSDLLEAHAERAVCAGQPDLAALY